MQTSFPKDGASTVASLLKQRRHECFQSSEWSWTIIKEVSTYRHMVLYYHRYRFSKRLRSMTKIVQVEVPKWSLFEKKNLNMKRRPVWTKLLFPAFYLFLDGRNCKEPKKVLRYGALIPPQGEQLNQCLLDLCEFPAQHKPIMRENWPYSVKI